MTMMIVVGIVTVFVGGSFGGDNSINSTLKITWLEKYHQLETRGSRMARGSWVKYPHNNMQGVKHTQEKYRVSLVQHRQIIMQGGGQCSLVKYRKRIIVKNVHEFLVDTDDGRGN